MRQDVLYIIESGGPNMPRAPTQTAEIKTHVKEINDIIEAGISHTRLDPRWTLSKGRMLVDKENLHTITQVNHKLRRDLQIQGDAQVKVVKVVPDRRREDREDSNTRKEPGGMSESGIRSVATPVMGRSGLPGWRTGSSVQKSPTLGPPVPLTYTHMRCSGLDLHIEHL